MDRTMERPFGVLLIAVLLGITGVLVLLAVSDVIDPLFIEAFTAILQVLFQILLGLGLLFLAYGLFTLQPWAWFTTLLVEGLSAVVALFTLLAAPTALGVWVWLIVAIAIIVYLTRPPVREAFGLGMIRV